MSKAIPFDGTLFIGCKACEGGSAERGGLPYNDKAAAEERIPAHRPTAHGVVMVLFGFIARKGRAADLVAVE